MKKIIIVFSSIILSILLTFTVSAEHTKTEIGFLEALDIYTLSENMENDAATLNQVKDIISQIFGKNVSVSSTQKPEVIRAFITAADYGYLLVDDKEETAYLVAKQIGLLNKVFSDSSSNINCAELSELAVGSLGVAYVQFTGYENDPDIVIDKTKTIATERFGAHAAEGVVNGTHEDGVNRIKALDKNEVTINGERYVLPNGQNYLNEKIKFSYIQKNGAKFIISVSGGMEISVQELEGKSGKAFFRRGIPFAEGELLSVNGVYLADEDGNIPEIQKEVLETYSDGSIRWLSVSFVEEMLANQTKRYELVFGERAAAASKNIATEQGGTILLDNGELSVTINEQGIKSIKYSGNEVLTENGLRLSVTDSSKHYFKPQKTQILRNGSVYAQVKISGVFTDTHISADWILYLYRGVNRLYQEAKIAVSGAVTLREEAFEFEFVPGLSDIIMQPDSKKEANKTQADWMSISGNNFKLILNSQDTERFSGAISGGINNGFIHESGSQKVLYAPIQTGIDFVWPDGVKRTAHLNMYFTDSNADIEKEAERENSWAFLPPVMVVDSSRYVKSNWLEDDSKSEVILRMDELVSSLHGGKLWHNFEAGKISNNLIINYAARQIVPGTQDRSAGEVEYNLWKTFMNTGNPKIYGLLTESSEHWTDIMQYWGKEKTLYGTNRYQTGTAWNRTLDFELNQPYYGDMSGIYMTYMMTGDPMYEEAFRAGVDFWANNIKLLGVPNLSYWNVNKTTINEDPEFHARFMAQFRGMGLAYDLYKEEKFLDAIITFAKNLRHFQNANGSFYENYNRITKEPYIYQQAAGVSGPNEKYYIMLMGGRMLIETYNSHPNEWSLDAAKRLAEFLLSVTEADGWYFSPHRTHPNLAERGCDGTTNSMAANFFAEMYEATGEEKYFYAMGRAFRFYTSQWNGGNAGRTMHTAISNYLATAPKVSRLIQEQEALSLRLGFADILALLDTNTVTRQDLYPGHDTKNGRFSLNAYDTKYGRVVTLNHVASAHAETYGNKAFDLDFCADKSTKLWFGDVNTVTANGIYIRRPVKEVDLIYLLQTDIAIKNIENDVVAQITEYTKDRISISLKGNGAARLTARDGLYPISEGEQFKITVDGAESVFTAKATGLCISLGNLTENSKVTIERLH